MPALSCATTAASRWLVSVSTADRRLTLAPVAPGKRRLADLDLDQPTGLISLRGTIFAGSCRATPARWPVGFPVFKRAPTLGRGSSFSGLFNTAARRPHYAPLMRTEQQNHGRRPPKWQPVQVSGTRCSMNFPSVAI